MTLILPRHRRTSVGARLRAGLSIGGRAAARDAELDATERKIRALTAQALVIDFAADDLAGYADGAAVPAWPARRGGLTGVAFGTPTYADPDTDLAAPSVAYSASGDWHAAAAVDWSAYRTATLVSVWISNASSANGGIMSLHADLADYPSQSGGLEHLLGASSGYWTALHRPDGAGDFWLERDTAQDTGTPQVTISVHDTAASVSADEIRGYQNGTEITGSTTGTSGAGAYWQSTLYPVIGGRGNNAFQGLDGRAVRSVWFPGTLTDGAIKALSAALGRRYGITA